MISSDGTASFEARGFFVMDSRSIFVIHGEILDGTVQVGMHARVEESRSLFDEPVSAVEFVDGVGTEKRSEVALVFRYGNDLQLRNWTSLGWEGRRLAVSW